MKVCNGTTSVMVNIGVETFRPIISPVFRKLIGTIYLQSSFFFPFHPFPFPISSRYPHSSFNQLYESRKPEYTDGLYTARNACDLFWCPVPPFPLPPSPSPSPLFSRFGAFLLSRLILSSKLTLT